ncbi:MAG TPA: universal stress protein [Thermodesulfobacteriota bacterium]
MSDAKRPGPILVPLDLSDLGSAGLEVAGLLARVTGAPIRLLHVAPPPRVVVGDGTVVAYADQEAERLRGEAEDRLEEMAAPLAGLAVERAVRFGDPAQEIMAEAEACGASFVVMSTHGRGGLARLAMGSVAEAVARKAPCPVVTVSPRAGRRFAVAGAAEGAEPAATTGEAGAAAGPAAPERRCLACGQPSRAAFCQACEARIRGEAIEYKRGEERAGRTGRAG